jgi:hypothetical protein
VRQRDSRGTAWRFAVAASLPFLLLLSLAATARDVYAAPALLGVSLLIALEVAEAQRLASQSHRDVLLWTRCLVATITCVFAAGLTVFGIAGLTSGGNGPGIAIAVSKYFGAAAVMLVLVWLALRRAVRSQRHGQVLQGFQWTYAAYTAVFCITSLAVFPAINRWHDLPLLAAQIRADTEHASLALLDPDETTIAMLDRGSHTSFTDLTTGANQPRSVVRNWFIARGNRARILVLLPGHAPGELTPLLQRVHLGRTPGDGIASALQTEGIASIVRRYQLPHGRRYALLAPGCATCSDSVFRRTTSAPRP